MRSIWMAVLSITLMVAMGESASAGLANSLGFTGKKADRHSQKSLKKSARKPRGNSGGGPITSPYTTALAQIFRNDESLYTQIRDGYAAQQLSRSQARNQARLRVNQSYRSVTRDDRKVFKQANARVSRGGVRKDWFAYIFNNGFLPIYY